MAKQTPLTITLLPLLLLLTIFTEVKVEGANKLYGIYNSNAAKLFVFGDSYLDTGNVVNFRTYKPPYGITFPGKPTGRFSDGQVLTDYVASFLKIKSPAPYELWNPSELQYGMNFAHGLSGILDTVAAGHNMTSQIDQFEKLIDQKLYTKDDLESSVALVHAGYNDYFTYALSHPNMEGVEQLTEDLIKQMSLNLKRIQSLGVGKIAVALLEPMGCMPHISMVNSYKECVEPYNSMSQHHSQKLLQAVQELNKELGKSVFVTLDLYNSFLSTIATMQKNSTLMNPLQPCCVGTVLGAYCGSLNDKGEKMYNLCEKPELSFFWDIFDPSQNGWYAVSEMLQSSLHQLTEKNF